jgi:hypothetical protein
MLFDDLVQIALVDIGVPRAFGIDHDHRAVVTTVHAAGRVDADAIIDVGDAELFDFVFDVIAHLLRAVVIAAALIVGALVGAEKDMFVEVAHGCTPVDSRWKLYVAHPIQM